MPISTIGTNSLSSTAKIGSLTTASGSAPSYSARAWVNFNGTGTVAIRASGNVSSITDNGTGDYTVNFTTAMQDADYAAAVQANGTVGYYALAFDTNTGVYTARATGAYRFNTLYASNTSGGGAVADSLNVYVAIFR